MTYADGNILGRGKKPVDEDTHEGRVETILDVEERQLGVGHALGYDNAPDGNACAELAW